jgi:hypothetical protein
MFRDSNGVLGVNEKMKNIHVNKYSKPTILPTFLVIKKSTIKNIIGTEKKSIDILNANPTSRTKKISNEEHKRPRYKEYFINLSLITVFYTASIKMFTKNIYNLN